MTEARLIGRAPDWWEERKLIEVRGRLFLVEFDIGNGCRECKRLIESAGELPTWLDDDALENALDVLDNE